MVRTVAITQFLDATVEAGHRYYVLARFIYGHGFQLRPLRPSAPATTEFSTANPKFKEWLADATWPAHTDEYPASTDPARFAAKLGRAPGRRPGRMEREDGRPEGRADVDGGGRAGPLTRARQARGFSAPLGSQSRPTSVRPAGRYSQPIQPS